MLKSDDDAPNPLGDGDGDDGDATVTCCSSRSRARYDGMMRLNSCGIAIPNGSVITADTNEISTACEGVSGGWLEIWGGNGDLQTWRKSGALFPNNSTLAKADKLMMQKITVNLSFLRYTLPRFLYTRPYMRCCDAGTNRQQ